MMHADARVGQVVKYRGNFGKIIKVNPKNLKVELESGEVWNMPPMFVTADETGHVFVSVPSAAYTLGSLVRFTKTARIRKPRKSPLLVVIKRHSDGTFNLAPLGGDGGMYYRKISASMIEAVDYEMTGI